MADRDPKLEGYNSQRKRADSKQPLGYDDQDRPIWAKNQKGEPVCGAYCAGTIRDKYVVTLTNDQGLKICASRKRGDNGRCRKHRGKIKDWGKQHLETQRYYKVLNSDAAKAFMDYMNDPTLLTLRKDVALNAVRLDEEVRELSKLDQYTLDYLSDLCVELQVALAEDALVSDEVQFAGKKIVKAVRKLKDKKRIGESVERMQKHHKDLVMAEVDRKTKGRQALSIDKVYAILMQVLTSLTTHVHDVHVLREIRQDIAKVAVLPEEFARVLAADKWRREQARDEVIDAEFSAEEEVRCALPPVRTQ